MAGFALGGGCELAMMADFILAADNAKFGQPEIKLGIAPGMGGTQRLARAVGKAKAMEMCLTGRQMGAEEAERSGLVSRIIATEHLIAESLKAARTVAGQSQIAAMMNNEMVNLPFDTTLTQGLISERRMFQILANTQDKIERMNSFVEKRKPNWTHR